MPDTWTDDSVRLSDLFVQVLYKTLSQDLISELSDSRVSLPQMQAMRYIWLHDDALIGDLAEGLQISYPSASNMVTRLERQGLAAREPDPKDRREVHLRLTAHGRAITERMERERVDRLRQVLDRLPEQDREALLSGLHKFVSLAVGDDEEAAHAICLRCGSRASTTCPIAEKHSLQICR